MRRNFINSFLRIFKVWGDCSFVVEEAEALILWAFTEAHQTILVPVLSKKYYFLGSTREENFVLRALNYLPRFRNTPLRGFEHV